MDIEQILKRNSKKASAAAEQGDRIFALDIGTRTVVGIIGEKNGDNFKILECVSLPHTRRAMVDGQVEDIKQVAKIVGEVKAQLEEKIGCRLQRACIAAAGRALKTVNISKDFNIADSEIITEEMVASMEMETISLAQTELDEETKDGGTLFYCVGHNVVSYYLDDYKMISLTGHKGQKAQINMVVAFLPGIVIEGLYSVMELNKLEVQSLTLEPIAAMNVIIPPEIRLINIALVDIGAGTSDIAISKDGSIIAYAMATVAGDEITEEVIKTYLVDFAAAEQMKYDADTGEGITYKDIFGIAHTVSQEDFIESILPSMDNLAATICSTILKINGGSPQAVFLVGGGSLIKGLTTLVADKLDIDEDRVAVGGSEFVRGVDVGGFKMGAEYITPIGIGVTALNDRGYDFSVITINDKTVRVFDTKKLTVFQLLSAAGFKAAEIMGHSGQGLTFTLNGNKIFRKGTMMTSAEIRVNGKDAGLTTVVTQGDKVTLIPAKNGENAHTTLQKEIDYTKFNSGYVTFGSKRYKFGLEVTVNGKSQKPDYEIQPLDNIVTGGILSLGDLLESLGIEYSEGFLVNGNNAEQSHVLCDGDAITIKVIPSVMGNVAVSGNAPSKNSIEELNRKIQAVNSLSDNEPEGDIRTIQSLAASGFNRAVQQADLNGSLQTTASAAPIFTAVQAATVPTTVPVQTAAPAPMTAQTLTPTTVPAPIPTAATVTAAPQSPFTLQQAEMTGLKTEQASAFPYTTAQEQSGLGNTAAGAEGTKSETEIAHNQNLPKDRNLNLELYGVSEGNIPPITLTLNGSPITLPAKNDGEPHTFLELMSYANLDTKNPGGHSVELTLNDKEISFGEELHQGDKAVVRWKD